MAKTKKTKKTEDVEAAETAEAMEAQKTEETSETVEKSNEGACRACEDAVSESDTGGTDEKAGTTEGEPSEQEEPKCTEATVNAANGLNLRVGPGASFAVLEVLPMGTAVAVLALPYDVEVPGWALVHTGQVGGWVKTEFLTLVEP